MKRFKSIFQVLMALLLVLGAIGSLPTRPVKAANVIRISQAYGAGGNTGATYKNDFIELFNSSDTAVNLAGWSVQYASAAGTSWAVTQLTGTIPANGYYLIQEAAGTGGTMPLPTSDATGNIAMQGASNFKIALVDSTTALVGGCPAGVIDFLGGGTANCYESFAAPATTNITALIRKSAGCQDTDNNSADFTAATPVPRNSVSRTQTCRATINEFSASTTGTDVEYVEIVGSPNTDFSAYTVLEIEGDFNVTATGTVDEIISLGTTNANGIYLASLAADTLENGTLSLLLVKNNSAVFGQDLDTNDDGVLDITPWDEITDGVAVNDGDSGDLTYATPILGVGYDGLFTFAPGGASRIPDGFDTEASTDWIRNDFDLAGLPDRPGTIVPGEAYNTPGQFNRIYSEEAPRVVSTNPVYGGNHPLDADVTITFSEPVTVNGTWFSIVCTVPYTAAVTGGNTTFTLNPDTDFTLGEICTVTIFAGQVEDVDSDDETYNFMSANHSFTFNVVAPLEKCADDYTPIHTIQGTGETSPSATKTVSTEGVVVGDFQSGGLNGYYIQEPDVDADDLTSEGIFVYNTTTPVNVGDRVRVRGTIKEYNGITEFSPVEQVWICSNGHTVDPTDISLPVEVLTDFEKYESMLVRFTQDLVISEYFEYAQYGSIVLSATRHMNPTAVEEPGSLEQAAAAAAYLLDRVALDDGRVGSASENPDPARHPNGADFTMDNLFRGGGRVTNVTGVLDYYDGYYRVQPTAAATYTDFNPRTEAPVITEADLKIASFNVLNYFITLDLGPDICGPLGTLECRGADTEVELTRQRAKLLSALLDIDADVFGLMEIENDRSTGGGNAVADLVLALNYALGGDVYGYIDTGDIGTDAIKQAILYKLAKVTPVGEYQILDSNVDSRFIDTKNRPALAQTFTDNLSGKTFTVAVNHFKSKGSACDGDPDLSDGQGNCNLTRKAAAEALVDWLANDTLFSQNVLIIGDLNSYDKEDPIDMIKLGSDDSVDTDDDFKDMIFEKQGDLAYGYVFDGQTGYLDHALANQAMAENIVDVNFWHINADEPSLIDYDMTYKKDPQDALYAQDAYRSSDHDPVIITLDLLAPVIVSGTAKSTTDGDVIWTDGKFTVEQGYVVDTIEITMSEPVLVDTGTEVTMAGHGPYGTVTAHDGANITVTPYSGNGIAAEIGEFTFTVPANSVTDLVGNPFMESITLDVLNVAPIAVDDTGTVAEDGTLTVAAPGVLANDTDFDPAILTAVWASDPSNGTLTFNADGGFEYKPNANFNGTDTFTYKAKDGLAESTAATVTITVNPVNDAPVAVDDSASPYEDTPWNAIGEGGVLFNDTDVDGDSLTAVLVDDVDHGTLVLDTVGTYTYTPDPDFNGVDTFTYKANDGTADSNIATVTFTVSAAHDAPILTDIGAQAGDEETLITFTVTASDVDLPAQALTFSLTGTVPSGAAIDPATGVFTWTPTEAQGPAVYTFTVKVCDDTNPTPLCDEESITVTVGEVNVAPELASIGDKSVAELATLTFTATASDADLPHQTLTFSLVGAPIGATIDQATGAFSWTPTVPGGYTFTVKVCDNALESLCDEEEITVTVLAVFVNTAPVAVADAYETPQDVQLAIAAEGVLKNDTDADLDPLTVELVTGVGNGTVDLLADGSFTYTPAAGFFGEDSFTYKAFDGTDYSDAVKVTITVTESVQTYFTIYLPIIFR